MSSFANLFAGANFASAIQKFCAQYGWKIADINDKRVILRFNMESGRTQTLYIIKYDTTLEFSVPSALSYIDDNIPDWLSTILLKRNTERKIGFWCLEKIKDEFNFECMHNAEMQLIDVEYFGKVVRALIAECDELEGIIAKILSQ